MQANYLTRQWRKLLNSRKKAVLNSTAPLAALFLKPERVVSKRRLSSSPSELLFHDVPAESILLQNSSLEASTETLLLSALVHRAKNRELQELTLHSARRLLPLEQILPP